MIAPVSQVLAACCAKQIRISTKARAAVRQSDIAPILGAVEMVQNPAAPLGEGDPDGGSTALQDGNQAEEGERSRDADAAMIRLRDSLWMLDCVDLQGLFKWSVPPSTCHAVPRARPCSLHAELPCCCALSVDACILALLYGKPLCGAILPCPMFSLDFSLDLNTFPGLTPTATV